MTEEKPEFPSLIEQGKNLANTAKEIAKDAIKGKAILVPAEVKKKRLNTCKKCEYFYESAVHENENRCTACGCILVNKTSFASSQCPKRKWGKWNPEE